MTWPAVLRRTLFTRHERSWVFAALTAGLFAYVQIRAHLSHEMWKDELHCWAVGRNATGLWDLLTGERRYDGHPFLWYYVLHLVSRVHRSYVGLHVITIMLAVTAALLWLRYAPLPRTVRVLLLSSYYFVYEYGVISRSYILGIALTFAFCALYRPYRVRYALLATLLALLAATSMYGTLMALALGLFLFTRDLRLQRPDGEDDRFRISLTRDRLVGLAIYGVGLGVVALTTWPPADASYAPTAGFEFTSATLRSDFARYWAAMFPFHDWKDWNWLTTDHLGSTTPWIETNATWWGFAWFVSWLFALRRCAALAFAYGLGIFMMMAVQHGIYPAGLRHLGHYFILLLACIWLYGLETRLRAPALLLHLMLAINLAVQGVTGFAALRVDQSQLFSGTSGAAAFMQSHNLVQRPVVAYTDQATSPVAIILDRPFLFVGTNEISDVVLAHNRMGAGDHFQAVAAAVALTQSYGPTLIVLNGPLYAPIPPGFSSELLYQSTTPIIMFDETYWIYRVTTVPQAP